jgi:hypothetical protein
MRHRIREQSYVDPELLKQVRAYEAAMGCTHSAFTTEAYERLLATERGAADVIGARLDALAQRLDRHQNTLELFAMAFAHYTELWCRFLPPQPPTPESLQRAEKLYSQLLRGAARKFSAGRRFSGEVFPPTGDRVPPRPGSGPVGGTDSGKGPGR